MAGKLNEKTFKLTTVGENVIESAIKNQNQGNLDTQTKAFQKRLLEFEKRETEKKLNSQKQ